MVEKRQGDETSWTLGRETASTTSPISNKTDLEQRTYVATSFTVDENGEKAASDSLRAGFSDVFGELNGLWADGGITMEMPEGEGLLPIMQALLGDTAPVSTPLPEKRLVTAQAGTTFTTAASTTFFADTAVAAVTVLAGGVLTSGTSFELGNDASFATATSLRDDLNSYSEAQTLTLTASAAPDTATTIVINYNEDGEDKSESIAFSATDTSGTFTLPANSRIVNVGYTLAHWTSSQTLGIATGATIANNLARRPDFNNPGQLRFVLSAAVANGKITIKGLRKVGISSAKDWLIKDEVITLDATGTEATSEVYFSQIVSIAIVDSDGDPIPAGTTVTISSVPTGNSTVVKVQDAILPNYTIEAKVADVPRLITAAKFIGATINNEGTLNAELNVLAERSDRRRTVTSGFAEKFTTTMDDNPTEFPEVSIGFFTGIGGYLEIDGDVVLFNSSPITIDAGGYESPDEKNGSIFRPEAERTGRRQVTCAVNARYEAGDSTSDVYIKWDNKYRDNAAVKARIVQYRWADDGRQKALIWDLPYCEITDPVRVEATAPGSVPIVVNLKATPDPTTTETAEITLTIVNDDAA